MKKKIVYESKYLAKKSEKKTSQVYIVLGFLAFIFIVIIVVLFLLFGNEGIKDFNNKVKYDDLLLKNEIKLYLNLNEYENLNLKIDDYLKEDLNLKLKKNLVYLKLYILLTLNDISRLKEFLLQFKKQISKEDFYFINGYIYFLQKNYKMAIKELKKIGNNKNLFRDCAILLSKIYIEENNYKEAIDILEKIQDKDAIILYNLSYLYLSLNEMDKSLFYAKEIDKFNFQKDNLLFKPELIKTRISMENKSYVDALSYLDNIKEFPFLTQTYIYNRLVCEHLILKDNDKNNYKNFIDKIYQSHENFPYLIYQLIFAILYFEKQDDLAIEFFEKNKDNILLKDYEKYLALAMDLYNRTKNFDKSLKIISEINLSNISEKYFNLLLFLYYQSAKGGNALDQFEIECKNLIKSKDEKIYILNLLTQSLIENNKVEDGLRFLLNEKLFDIYPAQYYINLAKLYIAKNDEENVIKYLKIIEKIDIEDINKDEVYSFLCSYYLKTKKLEDFKNLFSLISEEGRESKENLLLFLEYSIKIKDYDSIIKISDNLIEKFIDDEKILFYIAKSYYEKKDYDKAIIYFSRLFEREKNKKTKAGYAIYLGNCFAYIQNISTALFYYKQAYLIDNEQTYSKINSQILEKLSY